MGVKRRDPHFFNDFKGQISRTCYVKAKIPLDPHFFNDPGRYIATKPFKKIGKKLRMRRGDYFLIVGARAGRGGRGRSERGSKGAIAGAGRYRERPEAGWGGGGTVSRVEGLVGAVSQGVGRGGGNRGAGRGRKTSRNESRSIKGKLLSYKNLSLARKGFLVFS